MNDNMMWALVKEKPEQGLWMKRVPIPEVGPNDVKIKIHKNAICGTDVHIYQWNDWAQHTIPIGLTAGHEYVGEVVEVGAGVQGFKQDLKTGEAYIISDVSGERQAYHIMMDSFDYSPSDRNKGIHFYVDDERLLSLTGGIVQGMSGSPIIQDGRIVGAVTHVLIQDSSRGYGIFIDEMLSQK